MTEFFDKFERELVGALQREQGHAPPAGLVRAKRRPRKTLSFALGIAALAVAAVVAIGTGADRGTLLSPDAAIADVRGDLRAGVLHWRSHFATSSGSESSDSIDLWVDLGNHESRQTRTQLTGIPPRPEDTTVWTTALATFYQFPQPALHGRVPIVRVANGPESAQPATPIDQLASALARAAAGRAVIQPTVLNGQRLVSVRDTERGLQSRLWISRDPAGARLVRAETTTWSCGPNESCAQPSNDATTALRITDEWTITATARSYAEARPPNFGDGHYELRSEQVALPPIQ